MESKHHTIRDLFRDILKRYRRQTVYVVSLMVMCGFAEGLGIMTMMPFVRMLTDPSGSEGDRFTYYLQKALGGLGIELNVGVLLSLITMLLVLKSLFVVAGNVKAGYSASRVSKDFRSELISTLMKTKYNTFLDMPLGTFSNALTTETRMVLNTYKQYCLMLSTGIQGLFYLGLALLVSWPVTLASVFIGALLILSLGRFVAAARKAGKLQATLMRSISVRLTDGIYCIKTLKAMGQEDTLSPVLQRSAEELRLNENRIVRIEAGLVALQEPIIVIALGIGLFVGIQHFGMRFEALIVLALLFWRTAQMIAKTQNMYQRLSTTEGYYWSVRNLIDRLQSTEEYSKGTQLPHFRSSIELVNVGFNYGKLHLYDSVNLRISKGAYVALIGPSGAGKTTLADICIGLLAPTTGKVLVDGVSVKELNLQAWRKKVGYVQQESHFLFSTVADNVSLLDPAITEEDIKEALQLAGAWEFVSQLPGEIHASIGENAGKLSGGQRQRLAIARALARKPEVLVLDEATTALDPKTEAAICDTIQNLKGRVTIIAISHQKALVDIADKVYRVEKGQPIREALPVT